MEAPEEVLAFWFEETDRRNWWTVDAAFDDLLRTRFLGFLQQASAGVLPEDRADVLYRGG